MRSRAAKRHGPAGSMPFFCGRYREKGTAPLSRHRPQQNGMDPAGPCRFAARDRITGKARRERRVFLFYGESIRFGSISETSTVYGHATASPPQAPDGKECCIHVQARNKGCISSFPNPPIPSGGAPRGSAISDACISQI